MVKYRTVTLAVVGLFLSVSFLASSVGAAEKDGVTMKNGKMTRMQDGKDIGQMDREMTISNGTKISLNGKEDKVIGGFTGDQRFFLGFAQIWRFKSRDEALRNQLLTDAHSPGYYRAFVPLTNIDAWYKAFNVKRGDKLYRAPEDRVKIWKEEIR